MFFIRIAGDGEGYSFEDALLEYLVYLLQCIV